MNVAVVLKKAKQFRIASACVVLSAALLVGIFVRGVRVPQLLNEQSQLTSEYDAMLNNEKYSEGLAAELEELEKLSTRIEERLLEREERVLNQDYFYQLARRHDVRVEDFGQKDLFLDRREARRASRDHFSPIEFQLSVTGSYPRVMSFLHHLRHGSRFARVEAFTARTDESVGSETVQLDLQVSVLGHQSES